MRERIKRREDGGHEIEGGGIIVIAFIMLVVWSVAGAWWGLTEYAAYRWNKAPPNPPVITVE